MSRKLHQNLMLMLRQAGKKALGPLGLPTVQTTPMSNFFCQQNLTENPKTVENRDTYLPSSLMAFGKLGNGVRALAAATMLAGAAEAQEVTRGETSVNLLSNSTSAQITDCVGFVREQRELAQETGITMSRAEQMTLLADCHGGLLAERIAEQERIIAALNEEIAQYQLRVDEQARIIDAQGRELARIVAINNQLIIRRAEVQSDTAAVNADTEEMLQEAERILQSLAMS